ncbi:MAG: DUF2298 domain-containing protein [Halorhabdus sp.]
MEFGLVVLWLALYLGLLYVGATITSRVLAGLADGGAGVAIPAALALVWIVTYVVGRLSITVGLWLGLVTLAALATWSRYRGHAVDRTDYLQTAAVFSVAFLFMVAIRAVDPAVHPAGGEKFLDFGLLQSLLRAETLPPEDMWFAGKPVKYYYGGHLLSSLLARMTNTSARYAYNLAHAGFYAMFVTAAFGLARSIAAHRKLPPLPAGLFAAFFVGIASNLLPAGQLVVLVLPGGLSDAIAGLAGFQITGLSTGLSGFSYWTASRIIPGTINEFPLFAWLNGDMHAHMMSTPFLLLAATLLYGYYRTPAGDRRRRLGLLVALVPLAAMLAVVNTWSFPSVGGLTVLTLAMAPASPTTLLPSWGRRRIDAGVQRHWSVTRHGFSVVVGLFVLAVGYVLSVPFWLYVTSVVLAVGIAELAVTGVLTSSPAAWLRHEAGRHLLAVVVGGGVLAGGAVVSFPFWTVAAGGQRGIGLLPDRSGLGVLLLVHGAFLLVFGLYYYRYTRPRLSDPARTGALLAFLFAVAVLTDAAVLVVAVPLVLVGWLLTRTTAYDELPGPGYETVLIVGAAGLVVLVEFIYVKEQAGPGRMNTVFKVYAQVWALWATAMGVALVGLFADERPSLSLSSPAWRRRFRVLAAVLLVSTSIYGAFAMANHFDGTDEATLDALAFVETSHPGEAPAIHWLNEQVDGQPNMVSKPGTDIYQWVNAPSSLTGVPTLAGWVHEVGYRDSDAYWRRVEDVETIFTGDPPAQRSLLAAYDVQYVYVGPLERAAYPEMTVTDLRAVTVAKQWDTVTIYRVDQSTLDA